ncbi:MAG: hypothetical protein PVJ55_03185 [Anaerolineae bacterium]|jgi:hypothetical protein
MAEEQTNEQRAERQQSAEDAWREVGRQFEALGESLSTAFRAAWEREETQQHVRSMQAGLEKLVDRVDRAVKEAAESREGRRLRAEAEQTAESLRHAGEQTWQEVRPELLNALTKANAELQRFIDELEQKQTSGGRPQGSASDADSEG